MDSPLRSIRLHSGHVLTTWDANTRAPTGQSQLRYALVEPLTGANFHGMPCNAHGAAGCSCPPAQRTDRVLFCGADYGVAPSQSIDSDGALLGLLGFLSLRPGDTDAEYFAEYTDAQLDWARSSACESLNCDVHAAEEASGCACGYAWTDLTPDWTECDDGANVAEWQCIDHGEDGSQYFPGCGAGRYTHVVTGVGDTAREALDDALECAAQNDAVFSPLQVKEMTDGLSDPDRSAHDASRTDECETNCECDWNHYVSIRYNVRGE